MAFATVLISWDATHGELAERPTSWLEEAPVDAWILHTATQDPYDAAARWTSDADDRETAIDRWLAEYGRLGIEWIAYGAVIMQRRDIERHDPRERRPGRHPAGRREPPRADVRGPEPRPPRRRPADDGAGRRADHQRATRARRLAAAGFELRLRDGLRFAADLDADAAAVVRSLDGRATLGELGLGVDERRFVRRLTELGFAELA